MESGLLDRTTGKINSFQENLNDNMAAISNAGTDNGTVTLHSAPNLEQPSINAASSSSFGSASK